MSQSAWYEKYLRSDHWQDIRALEYILADYCCEFCGTPSTDGWGEGLHVHHLSYANVGNERIGDLIVLCSSCHADVHQFPRREHQIRDFAYRRPLGIRLRRILDMYGPGCRPETRYGRYAS